MTDPVQGVLAPPLSLHPVDPEVPQASQASQQPAALQSPQAP